jgi:hypothetical protein
LLHTKGGVRGVLGTDINKNSLDLTLNSALKLKINGTDENGKAMISTIKGDVEEYIKGNKLISIEGSLKIITNGLIDEQIRGTKLETYVNDKHTNYGGDFTTSILGKKQENIGTASSTSISGNPFNSKDYVKKTKIMSGSDFEEILIGDKILSIVTSGNIKESVMLGNKEIVISVGDYKVNITTGNVSITTSLGSVTISGSANVKVSGLTVESEAIVNNVMKAGGIAIIDSPIIQVGNGATQPIPKGFELISWLASHTHVAPFGPTTPPIIIPPLSMLSMNAFVK